MMPYQSYQIYQAERPRTAAEIRRADVQLGHMAENISWLWQHATRPIARLRGQDRRAACSALLDAYR
jgi:primase-polymerase (primpol)-like protein